jgi:hypothetical protein
MVSDRFKPVIFGLRVILVAAAMLALIAGYQVFVLTEHTDRDFAWTIANPLTAAFMGAGYWASLPMLLHGARQTIWANFRASFFSPLVFSSAMLVASLRHLGAFHFSEPNAAMAIVTAWLWMAAYVIVPVCEVVLLWLQLRRSGIDPPRGAGMPQGLRAVLAAQGLIAGILGLLLFFAPAAAAPHWPWKLTPLTAQVVGGWLLATAVAAGVTVYETDWRRITGPIASYTVLGILELVALARFPSALKWPGIAAEVYLAFLISMVLAGAVAWILALRPPVRHRAPG